MRLYNQGLLLITVQGWCHLIVFPQGRHDIASITYSKSILSNEKAVENRPTTQAYNVAHAGGKIFTTNTFISPWPLTELSLSLNSTKGATNFYSKTRAISFSDSFSIVWNRWAGLWRSLNTTMSLMNCKHSSLHCSSLVREKLARR